jgi:hypothetical protein
MQRIRSEELERTPAFTAHLAKFPSLAASLALLFHLTDLAYGATGAGAVSTTALELALNWCDFLVLHTPVTVAPNDLAICTA